MCYNKKYASMKQFKAKISTAICSSNFHELPNGLMGNMGWILINAICNKRESYDKAIKGIMHLIKTYGTINNGLISGNFGLIWLLGWLRNRDIIDFDGLEQYAWNVINRNSMYFANSPIRYDSREAIYPFGVGMIEILPKKDSYFRYEWEEQIIFKLCDCENILSDRIPGIYTPKSLSYAMLHSILAFALLAERHKIYTYKANQVKEIIKNRQQLPVTDNDIDHYVLAALLKQDCQVPQSNMIRNLAYVGTLSLIYDEKDLFADAYESYAKVDSNIDNLIVAAPISQKIGIMLGLVNEMYNGRKD